MITKGLLGAVAVLVAALGWALWRGELASTRAERAEAKVANLESEIRVAERTIAQVREARAVDDARAKRLEARAKELDDLRATLEGVGDEPLPDWFRAYLLSLFATNPN